MLFFFLLLALHQLAETGIAALIVLLVKQG